MTSDKIEEIFNNIGSNEKQSFNFNPKTAMDFKGQTIHLNTINFVNLGEDYGSEKMIKRLTELATEVEAKSAHPKYKVGCVIAGRTKSGKTFIVTATNDVPENLKDAFPIEDTKAYGGGSATTHAEMRAFKILKELNEDIESLYVVPSRTPCPSCGKVMSIYHNAGEEPVIKGVFTNGKTLSGFYGKERGEISSNYFWKLARPFLEPIFKKGNIRFSFVGDYKSGKHTKKNIEASKPHKRADSENSVTISKNIHQGGFKNSELLGLAERLKQRSSLEGRDKAGAVAIGKTKDGKYVMITASSGMPPGMTYERDKSKVESTDKIREKKKSYNLRADPLEIINGHALRHGIEIKTVYMTDTPPSGVLLDAKDNGLEEMVIPPGSLDMNRGRNQALIELEKAGKLKKSVAFADSQKAEQKFLEINI